MKRVLITGGSGFIGTNLVAFHLQRGDTVQNIDCAAPRNAAHQNVWREADILDGDKLCKLIAEFDPHVVYHMAARTDLDGVTHGDYAANIEGVENMIAALAPGRSLERTIFASSRLVCEIGYQPKDEFDVHPTTLYGQSKAMGEAIVRNSTLLSRPWTIVRPTSIWGPWFDVPYKTFFLSIARARYVHAAKYKTLKSFGFVLNTVHELDALVNSPLESVNGRTLYLADYPPIEVRVMADAIQREMNVADIRTVPVVILRGAAHLGDVAKALGWRAPPLTTFRLRNLLSPMEYDLTSLEKIVGPLPYSMQTGIKLTVTWLREQKQI